MGEFDFGFARNKQVKLKSQVVDKIQDPSIQDLKVTRELLIKHFRAHDPIIAALDSKIQLIATGVYAKDPLIRKLWSAHEKLREHFGADDPIIDVLMSKIRLARADFDALAQQGRNFKDSKQPVKRDGHQGLKQDDDPGDTPK